MYRGYDEPYTQEEIDRMAVKFFNEEEERIKELEDDVKAMLNGEDNKTKDEKMANIKYAMKDVCEPKAPVVEKSFKYYNCFNNEPEL